MSEAVSPAKVWIIHENDNVGTVVGADAGAGTKLPMTGSRSGELVTSETIPYGHKVALTSLVEGQPVIKYGVPIGLMEADVAPGGHVHSQNLQSSRGRGDKDRG